MMYREYILINFCLALVLVYINGFLGKIQSEYNDVGIFDYGHFSFSSYEEFNFSGNYAQKIINPTIYMALVTAVFQGFGLIRICYSLWMIILFYWGIVFMRIVLLQKLDFVNWNYELIALAVSIILCEVTYFFVIKPLLDSGETVFISLTEFRDAIWYAILAYIALTMWKIGKLHFNSSQIVGEDKIGKIISKRYKNFSDKYGAQIEQRINEYDWSERNKLSFACLVYAVMIYEDYNRPKLCRCVERVVKFFLANREMTLGIMQIKTTTLISDEESINLGIDKLRSAYLSAAGDPVCEAISDYNNGEMYHNEVSAIYEALFDLLLHQQSPERDDADDSDAAEEAESLC